MFATGDNAALIKATTPLQKALSLPHPILRRSSSVALGFRCGLFNIGAEGQFFIGALCSAFVGYSLKGLPMIVYSPLALMGGALGVLFGA